MKLNLTIFSFLFFSAMMKTNKEWNLIRFVFHFCRFRRLLSILAKRNQSSFFLDCGLRNRDFDQIDRNDGNLNRICKECFEFVLFCFFFLIWGLLKRRNVERGLKSACSQHLVKLEKERKEKCDFSHLSNWMKLPRDWIGWMVEIGCNQPNNGNSTKQNKRRFRQRQNSIFFFFQRVREMWFSLVFIPFFRHFSNDFCKSRSI